MDNLSKKGSREGNSSQDVGGLAGIVGKELGEVLERTELRFGDGFEYVYFLRGGIYVVETMAGRR